MDELVGGRRRDVHAGTEIRDEEKLADLLAAGLERHDEAGDAHARTSHALDQGRTVPLLAHALQRLGGARVVVLELVELEAGEEALGVPVGRDEVVPADLAELALARRGRSEAIAHRVLAGGLAGRGLRASRQRRERQQGKQRYDAQRARDQAGEVQIRVHFLPPVAGVR